METIISNFKNYTISTDGTIRNKNDKANTAGGYIWKWEKGAMNDDGSGYGLIDRLRAGIGNSNGE